MTISCDVSNPTSIVILYMIKPRKAAFGRRTKNIFWDDMIVLLIKPSLNLETTFKFLISIRAPTFIHLSVF